MSTARRMLFRCPSALLLAVLLATPVRAGERIAPFKDDLFSGQTVIETAADGDFTRIDYQEMRDINGRDQEPERRVKRAYVDLSSKRDEAFETIDLDGTSLEIYRAGQGKGFSLIFIHGRDGDRRLGANDWRFGGNFNRLKNLAIRNDGLYVAPTIRRFDATGVAEVRALILSLKARAPAGKVILACASMGSFLCWGITREADATAALSGMAILGGASDPDFAGSAYFKARKPIWFTHGSADKVYPVAGQVAFWKNLHDAGYPTRMTVFETGSHGTPVRMTDWRALLDWLLG